MTDAAPAPLVLFNSLTRQAEPFVPVHPGEARVYTCGPTVYNYPHIGNMRAYVFADVLGIPVENVAVNEFGGLGGAMCSAVGTGLYKDSQEAFVIAVARMDSGHTNHSITIDHESRTNHTLIDLAV